jgi:uncharacterized RDD family membrane protein YckC
MKKITELTEIRWRTIHLKDAYGNRHRDTEEYIAKRPVKSIANGPRFGHFIIDTLCFYFLIIIVTFGLDLFATINHFNLATKLTIDFFASIVSIIIYPGLYAFCEHKWQRTPGKFFTKSLIIDEYGNKPDLKAIILRSIVRIVPFDAISCYGDKYSHGWHDRWAKTWVVTDEELLRIKKLQNEQADQ